MTSIDRVFEGQMIDETTWFELGDFCTQLSVERSWVAELVDAGVLEPRGPDPAAWAFPASALTRARATVRLTQDLGVNLAGVAVILDLVEERRRLMRRVEELEQLLGE
jgi:chaperone modulatory protein CbpM